MSSEIVPEHLNRHFTNGVTYVALLRAHRCHIRTQNASDTMTTFIRNLFLSQVLFIYLPLLIIPGALGIHSHAMLDKEV